jgi:hypothetical protein
MNAKGITIPPNPNYAARGRAQSGDGHWTRQRGRLPTKDERLARLLMNPANFAEIVLGMKLYPKQREALEAIAKSGSRVSLAAANGTGKTARVVNAAVLWHAYTFPAGKIKATSGSWPQVEDQMWPAIQQYKKLFPQWKWLETPYFNSYDEQGREGFFRGFSTNDPGKAEGDHGDGDEAPLLYIVDEAKSIPVWLRGVIEGRVRPDRLLLTSSHGFSEGWFYESQTLHKDLYHCVTMTADDCPHISREEIEAVKVKWAGNPSFANSILGYGFMPMTEDAVINAIALEELLAQPPQRNYSGEVHGFCDFAWSNEGDENVLALRRGNVVTIEARFNCDKLHGICDRFGAEFRRLGLDGAQISGDEGSGGKLIMDELDRRGYRLNRINNGSAAADDEHYANVAAEMWFEGSKQITLKSVVLPNTRDLHGQLLSRKRDANNQGKLAVERKIDMKGRGLPSPDLADACVPAGTLIHTDGGQIPIEKIKPGDFVLTPFGFSPVVKLHRHETKDLVRLKTESGHLELTGNHKVFTRANGWIRADSIMLTHSLESVDDIGIWNCLDQSFTRVEPIAFKQLADIITTRTGTAYPSDFFIESSGLSGTARFQRDLKCTIKTRIGRTTPIQITNSSQNRIMPDTICIKDSPSGRLNALQFCEDWKKHKSQPENGMAAAPGWLGTGSMAVPASKIGWHISVQKSAFTAGKLLRSNPSARTNFARPVAGTNSRSGTITPSESASFVERSFPLTNIAPHAIALQSAGRLQLSESVKVYNLTLESENAYYANGILVENCLGCMMPRGGFGTGTMRWAAALNMNPRFQPAMAQIGG